MRDAIVCGYAWAGARTIDRMALLLARGGARVLHCDSPSSLFRQTETKLRQLEPNLFTFTPLVFASRLNRFLGIPRIQGSAISRQILAHADALQLREPAFFYRWAGPLLFPLIRAMKAHGCPLVHVYTDYRESMEEEHVGQSDLTLVMSRTAFHRLRARWGERIRYFPHGLDMGPFRQLRDSSEPAPPLLSSIPRPRLGYVGSAAGAQLNTRILHEILKRHPEWSFLSFQRRSVVGDWTPAATLPNAHILPWQDHQHFAPWVAELDVGFMPYDCSNMALFNGSPLKLWDYFALGLPVVATPIIHLWEYEGLVYLGDTVQELEQGVETALAEPKDSPLREKRRELAERHSLETLARILEGILRQAL